MFSDCPICKARQKMEVTTKTEKIPILGRSWNQHFYAMNAAINMLIPFVLKKDPVKYVLLIGKDNLNARVVKSQSTTMTIPELGLKVEPGPQSQGYVSNVEGVLDRFEKAVKTALSWTEDQQSRENAVKIMEFIDEVKNGNKRLL